MIRVTATEYKHDALKLLEHVRVSGEVVAITKRGRAIAQLGPWESGAEDRMLGQFRDDALIVGDIVVPIANPREWGS